MVAMRWIAVAAGVLLVASLVGSEEQAAEEEEPPFLFTLEVNGVDYRIEPGELITLPPQKGELRIRLRAEPFRVLKASGVEFRFPRSWSARREKEAWVVQRGGFRVEIERNRYSDADEWAECFAKSMEEISAEMKTMKWRVVRNDRPLRLAGNEVKGVTVIAGRVRVVRTAYFVNSGRNSVRLLLSESREREDEPSETWKEMERWLQESLKVLPPTDK